MNFLRMNIIGAGLILVVMILRFFLRERLPKKTFLIVWMIVMVYLAMPVKLPASSPIGQTTDKTEIVHQIPEQQRTEFLKEDNQTHYQLLSSPSVIFKMTMDPSFVKWLVVIWITGAVLYMLRYLSLYFAHIRLFREALPVENEIVDRWMVKHPLKRSIRIASLDRIDSPLTYGILHPVILLPKNWKAYNAQELELILSHEYFHIRNRDAVMRGIMHAINAVYWFNPLVWLMRKGLLQDLEFYCDECVMKERGFIDKANYANLLIDEKERMSVGPGYSMLFTSPIEKRIRSIMKSYRASGRQVFASAMVVVTILALTLAGCQKESVYTTAYKQAQAYNSEHMTNIISDPHLDPQELGADYLQLLDPDGDGIMGYLEIPSIDVNMPIYHGTLNEVLQIGMGHMEGSSLPVGGESTHAVLFGYRCLAEKKMLSDIDKITIGDTFIITTCENTLVYTVDQIRAVEPEELSDIQVVRGYDYVSIVTETPYGINTHRLVVRGKRVS